MGISAEKAALARALKKEALAQKIEDGSVKRFFVDPEKLKEGKDYKHIRHYKEPKGEAK